MKKHNSRTALLVLTALLLNGALLTSCKVSDEAKNHVYADFDVKAHIGVTFPTRAFSFGDLGGALNADKTTAEPNCIRLEAGEFPMTVVDKMDIYETRVSMYPYKTLRSGEFVIIAEPDDNSEWATVYNENHRLLGYTKDGFMHAVSDGSALYAEIPVETGLAPDSTGKKISAYSHLVDVSKYLKVYYSTNPSNSGIDISQYDVKVSMKLSTNDTSIGEPFYNRNLCLLQYDTLQKFIKAIEIFKADGYTVVIYDAYRPTSVQQRWFDVVKVHKWVANPAIGMGGIHDRGTALDISLIDTATGKELDMPTPMHTFTVDSARSSTKMTDRQRANMDYMTNVMISCGFTYINSEWWHFQCVNTKNYLPTDHPLDSVPLVPSEDGLKG